MISKEYANTMLDELTGQTLFLGLSKTEPNASTGAVTGEPTAVSYERVKVGDYNTADDIFGKASGGIITNVLEIQFKTARQAWGELAYFFLSESETGNAILWGEITGGVTVEAETVPTFYEGELRISLDTALE